MNESLPKTLWQLQMFRRSMKKQQKLRALLEMIRDTAELSCLLVTHGDNNGALNWHFKQLGGEWTWADFEAESAEQIGAVTGDPVVQFRKDVPENPFASDQFDIVVSIDVHEHLEKPAEFNRLLSRIVKPGGQVVVTVPNGDRTLLAVKIKEALGMSTEVYGHRVLGFTADQLKGQLRQVELQPYDHTFYSKFFTEMLELAINFLYVKILARGGDREVMEGQIAPQTENQLRSVGITYRIYSIVYPLLRLISKMDALIPTDYGYAVVVAAEKTES